MAGLLTQAQNIPPRPNPPTLVNDFAGVLLKSEDDALEQKVVAYYDSTSTQIAVVTLKSIGDYDISQVGLKILRDWLPSINMGRIGSYGERMIKSLITPTT